MVARQHTSAASNADVRAHVCVCVHVWENVCVASLAAWHRIASSVASFEQQPMQPLKFTVTFRTRAKERDEQTNNRTNSFELPHIFEWPRLLLRTCEFSTSSSVVDKWFFGALNISVSCRFYCHFIVCLVRRTESTSQNKQNERKIFKWKIIIWSHSSRLWPGSPCEMWSCFVNK